MEIRDFLNLNFYQRFHPGKFLTNRFYHEARTQGASGYGSTDQACCFSFLKSALAIGLAEGGRLPPDGEFGRFRTLSLRCVGWLFAPCLPPPPHVGTSLGSVNLGVTHVWGDTRNYEKPLD